MIFSKEQEERKAAGDEEEEERGGGGELDWEEMARLEMARLEQKKDSGYGSQGLIRVSVKVSTAEETYFKRKFVLEISRKCKFCSSD